MTIGNLSGVNKLGAYAHFPGTGPENKSCFNCANLHKVTTKGRTCLQYARMKGVSADSCPRISESSPACRYFEEPKSDAA